MACSMMLLRGAGRRVAVLLSGLLLSIASNGAVIADPVPAPAFVFPVIQCTFEISFMNTEKNLAMVKQCPHLADKTPYVVTFSAIAIHADDAVSAGAFVIKAGAERVEDMTKGAQVTFKIAPAAPSASGFVWTAPGPIVREDTVQNPGPGAVAVVQFIDKGCGGANCAISGTLTIRAKGP